MDDPSMEQLAKPSGKKKDKKKKHQCEFCSYFTDRQDSLTRHINAKHKQKDKKKEYYCELCSYFTDKNNNLIRHVNAKHRKMDKNKKYNCHFSLSTLSLAD